jgi:hypothetical protein
MNRVAARVNSNAVHAQAFPARNRSPLLHDIWPLNFLIRHGILL